MTHDRVTATPADAARFARANEPENDGDLHERRNEALDSDFVSAAPIDCGGCEQPACLKCAFHRVFGASA